jgi:hypothetical protein
MPDLDTSRTAVNSLLEREKLHSAQSWTKNEFLVKQWLDALKEWEQKETFERAFQDDRMTIRGMGVAEKHRSAVEAEQKMYSAPNPPPKLGKQEQEKAYVRGAVGTFSRPESGISSMKLYYGVKGVMERANPANFAPEPEGWNGPAKKPLGRAAINIRPAGWTKKYWMGLHDLSASLLKGTKSIVEQRKWYTDSVWVFMPIPKQEDLILFNVLNTASKETGASPAFRQYMRVIASQMTRLKFAEGTDMHTTYTDIGGLNALYPNQGGRIRYGVTGIDNDHPITQDDIRRRKENALHYKRILSDNKAVTEVVIAYRCHGDGKTPFPMFATQAGENDPYVVIDKVSLRPLGPKIAVDGRWISG